MEEKETQAFVTNEKAELMKSTNHLLILLIAISAPFSGSSQIINTIEIDGNYVLGKRNGRWLSGDLSKTKYLGEICLNPNMPDVEEEIKDRENMLNLEIIYYRLGKSFHTQMYDIDMNFHEDWQVKDGDSDEKMTEEDEESNNGSTEDQDNEK